MRQREKVWESGGGIERTRGDKLGKNSLPQLADLGNPAISQQSESRSRWAMSLHLSSSLSIHLPAFFSSLPYSPHELASVFFSSPSHSFVLSPLTHDLLYRVSSFASTSLHSCLLLTHLSPSLMMSGTVWLVFMPDYRPQWAHFTPPGPMPASRPACGVTTDRQRGFSPLIRKHTE